MSVYVSSWVWRHSECDGNDLILMLALADYANDEGVCWPGILTLSERCRCSTRTVQRTLAKAVERHDLEIVARVTHDGDADTNLYKFAKYQKQGTGLGSALDGGGDKIMGVVTNEGGGGDKREIREMSPKPSVQPLLQPSIQPEEGAQARNGTEVPDSRLLGATLSEEEKEKTAPPLNGHANPAKSRRRKVPIRKMMPPSLEEFIAYAGENKISEADARTLFRRWSAGEWRDGKGNEIKSWKQKLVTFQDEGYLPSQKRARNEENDDDNKGGLNAAGRSFVFRT